MRFFLFSFLLTLSFNVFAESCEGFNACAELYTKLTGEKLTIDKNISDDMTLAVENASFTKETAKTEFPLYLNKNAVALQTKGSIVAMRSGPFLEAPIYLVSEGNLPRLFNKDAAVTFVYHAKHDLSKVAGRARGMASKKKNTKFAEFPQSKTIAVSESGEVATKIMNEIFKADK